MIIRVFNDAGFVFIDGRDDPVPCGTLSATASGSVISIHGIHSVAGSSIVACDYANSQIGDMAGSALPTVDLAMAYLKGVLGTKPYTVAVRAVAAMDLIAGQPLAIVRANNQLTLARADTYPLAFVVGLCMADTAAGFVVEAVTTPVARDDWTNVAGSTSLAVGQSYFLAPDGLLTLSPPSLPASAASIRVGQATDPQTFLFQPSAPIRL